MMICQLTHKEISTWQKKWRDVYASGVFKAMGRWTIEGKDYLAFDRRYMADFLQGGAAEVAYADAEARTLVFLFRDERREAGEHWDLGTTRKPSVAEMKELTSEGDVHVFPSDLSWTAFFHHEEVIPTYFCRSEWLSGLSEE